MTPQNCHESPKASAESTNISYFLCGSCLLNPNILGQVSSQKQIIWLGFVCKWFIVEISKGNSKKPRGLEQKEEASGEGWVLRTKFHRGCLRLHPYLECWGVRYTSESSQNKAKSLSREYFPYVLVTGWSLIHMNMNSQTFNSMSAGKVALASGKPS